MDGWLPTVRAIGAAMAIAATPIIDEQS
jgi:hypothetical protein